MLDFSSYCLQHPDQRFWQALRNWSGYAFVKVDDGSAQAVTRDTFNWEGKRHDENSEALEGVEVTKDVKQLR